MSISETYDVASELTSRVPLSHTQEFLRMFDQGDVAGPFGPRYNIVVGWRVRGEIDIAVLQQALDDVVARHDVLRAAIVRGEGTGYQTIRPPSSARLAVLDLPQAGDRSRDLLAEEFLGDIEAGSYDSRELPHMRVILGRFDDEDAVLALIAHHTASDGWSMQLLIRDIASCYAARRGHAVPALPEARSYQEYVAWQQANSAGAAAQAAREYWRRKLHDARILGVSTDHPRSAGLAKTSPVYRFVVPAELTSAALEYARATRCTPFMVFLAVYNVLLHKATGATDLVMPTLTSGRNHPEFQNTVGPFFNFILLRTDISDCATFRAVAEQTRRTCMEAYAHEVPFTQILQVAPEVMAPLMEDGLAACAIQAWQFSSVLDHELIGDLEYAEVRSRLLPQHDGTDIPDGALLTLDLDPSGQAFGNIAYNSNLFDESSMAALVADFRRILHNAIIEPDTPLREI